MKLLVLDQFSDLGGAQQQLCDLLPAFVERGWHATFALPGNGDLFGRVRADGFEAVNIECGPFANGQKGLADAARFLYQMPRLRRRIASLARDLRPDLVYCNGPRLLPAIPQAAPVVFHSHSYLPPGPSRRVAATALRRADAWVIANCEFVANCWRGASLDDRIQVIYNGVERAAVLRRASRWPVVGCVGRIAPQKGQLEFLAAAEAILAEFPEARFPIIGAPLLTERGASRYEQRVREAAARLPVEFRGWVNGGPSPIIGLDLLLVPSGPHEATTRVIPEAFAAGVPVVAFASGGIAEIVEHGVNGYLARSTRDMARLAMEILRSPQLRARLARRGHEHWRDRFTLERYRSQAAAFLERAAQAGGAARRTEPRRTSQSPPRRPESSHIRIG